MSQTKARPDAKKPVATQVQEPVYPTVYPDQLLKKITKQVLDELKMPTNIPSEVIFKALAQVRTEAESMVFKKVEQLIHPSIRKK